MVNTGLDNIPVFFDRMPRQENKVMKCDEMKSKDESGRGREIKQISHAYDKGVDGRIKVEVYVCIM